MDPDVDNALNKGNTLDRAPEFKSEDIQSEKLILPLPGVIFLLDLNGHIAAGYSQKEATELSRRAKLYSQVLRNDRKGDISFEIIEFGSLSELLSKVPVKHKGKKWQNLLIVTHGPGEAHPGLGGSIFFGDKDYVVSGSFADLLDFANDPKNQGLVRQFRSHVDPQASMQLITCGLAAHGPDVAISMRQLIGTEGQVITPRVDIGFDRHSGRIGTYIDPPDVRAELPLSEEISLPIRPIKDNEWMVIPAITVSELPIIDPTSLVPPK